MSNITKEQKEAILTYTANPVDAAYINALTDFINSCRFYGTKIDTVQTYKHGWRITFEGFDGDAICHDSSYGTPCPEGWMDKHPNDWYTGFNANWETIGFPWDGDDVSVHDGDELARWVWILQTNGKKEWKDWE